MAVGTVDDALATPASLVELRRDLHRHPELRFDVPRTAALVAERVGSAGWQVHRGIGGSGLLATLSSDSPGPHIMLRADMDALPVADTKDVPYTSVNAGATHACGHDVHTSVLVGVAEQLAGARLPAGRISLVFQPAEEMPYGEPSGATTMLEDGLFESDAPDAALALHCWPDLPAGAVGIDPEIAMAGKDAFGIQLRGRPAHAATPSRGSDAALAVAQLVSTLHAGFARSLDPGDLAVLNVGTIRAGTSQSILAPSAEITGSFRSVDPAVRERLRDLVERTAAGISTTAGVEHEFTNWDVVPPVINDARLVRCARDVGHAVLGPDRTHELDRPPMTADDFAFFGRLAPTLYLKLGVRGPDGCPPLHDGAFDADERSIGVGVALMSAIARRLLERPLDTWSRGARDS